MYFTEQYLLVMLFSLYVPVLYLPVMITVIAEMKPNIG